MNEIAFLSHITISDDLLLREYTKIKEDVKYLDVVKLTEL